MAQFSKKSLGKLSTVHTDLITLFSECVKHRDCTVTSGIRTMEEQQALYAQGRTTDGNIVTYRDGTERRSNHQSGDAVDVVPYPTMWSDIDELKSFGSFVQGLAIGLKKCGLIQSDITWGGDWNFKDYPHYEIKK